LLNCATATIRKRSGEAVPPRTVPSWHQQSRTARACDLTDSSILRSSPRKVLLLAMLLAAALCVFGPFRGRSLAHVGPRFQQRIWLVVRRRRFRRPLVKRVNKLHRTRRPSLRPPFPCAFCHAVPERRVTRFVAGVNIPDTRLGSRARLRSATCRPVSSI
jgi:hypothetical protein